MLKIKVNIDKKSLNILLDDMKTFKILKKDGSINKNRFLNLLFENFYKEYIEETKMIIENTSRIMKKYNLNNRNFANELSLELKDYKNICKDTYFNESLTFYLSEKNEFIFETLNNELMYLGASKYFRNLIYRYLEYPQYKREEIIFKPILEDILDAIKNKNVIKLKLENTTMSIRPFCLGTSKEEIYSYLLGISKGTPVSIHLYKIRQVISLNETYCFTSKENDLLGDISQLGIQYPFKEHTDAIIELNENGQRLFESKYLNRPEPYKITDGRYYFKCSFDQLVSYFLAFGGKMKVIQPDSLAKAIYKSYKHFVEEYENTIKEEAE